MNIQRGTKEAFSVIGREGSTKEGDGFIQKLWQEANAHFDEISDFTKRNESGKPILWGAMSDFSMNFQPWEDHFTKGLYLAGAEVKAEAQPPQGWKKWNVPAYEYLSASVDGEYQKVFQDAITYIGENGLELAGAVQEYYCPEEENQVYLFFPVRRL